MKRDMDLIRKILLDFENGERWVKTLNAATCKAMNGDDDNVVSDDVAAANQYHMKLLREAELVDASPMGGGWLIESMTWAGHDFLDSVRDETVWAKTKEITKSVGSVSFSSLKTIAEGVATRLIASSFSGG